MSETAQVSYDQAIALREAGKLVEALEVLRILLAAHPNNIQILLTTGFIYGQLTEFELSSYSFDQVLALDPAHEQALQFREISWLGLAQKLADAGKWEEALPVFDQLLALNPTHVVALFDRGRVLKLLRRYREALRSFERTKEIDADFVAAYLECGDILQYHGFFDAALFNFQKAQELSPKNSMAYRGLALVHQALKSHPLALQAIASALDIDPTNETYRLIRQDILLDLGEHEQLLNESLRNIQGQSTNPSVVTHHANLLAQFGQHSDALSFYDKALALDASYSPARHGKGNTLSALGKWRESYRYFPAIDRCINLKTLKSFNTPIWDGTQNLEGKHLLIYFEAGLGDCIMHVRFALHIVTQSQSRNIKITLQVPRGLIRLLDGLGDLIHTIRLEDSAPNCDYVCSQFSLVAALNIESHSVPYADKPYIHVLPTWRETWQDRIGEMQKNTLRVGLVWAGGYAGYDFRRSLQLAQLAPLLQIPNIAFYSFQKNPPNQTNDSAPSIYPLIDYTEHIQDFADTAVLMEQVDLLIGCDTSVIHLAGAMGKPTWMLSRFDGPWTDNLVSNSPWYDSLRVYKQTLMGQWDDVINRIASDLKIYETI